MRPSHAPLGGAQPQPPAPPPNPDMGFFDPAIMAMGTGKAFEYKPPPPSSSPNEAMSPGLLSILKNLGGPPSSNPPNGGEGFPNPGSGLPFFPPPSGQKTPPVRQQGFGGLAGPAFQPPLQSEQYSQVVTSSGKDSGHENGKGEASGSRPGSGGVVPRSPGVWGLGEAPAAQMGKDPAPQMRAQRGGLSSMMAAIGGPGTHATAPSFASAVAASQGANPPGFGVGGVPGANNPGQSSWAAIAAVKTPSAAKQHPPEAEKRGAREGGRVDGASKEREVIKQGEMGSEGFGKVEKRGAEEKETQVWVEVGEGSDGGQEEGEEDAGKVLNEEEEKVRSVPLRLYAICWNWQHQAPIPDA